MSSAPPPLAGSPYEGRGAHECDGRDAPPPGWRPCGRAAGCPARCAAPTPRAAPGAPPGCRTPGSNRPPVSALVVTTSGWTRKDSSLEAAGVMPMRCSRSAVAIATTAGSSMRRSPLTRSTSSWRQPAVAGHVGRTRCGPGAATLAARSPGRRRGRTARAAPTRAATSSRGASKCRVNTESMPGPTSGAGRSTEISSRGERGARARRWPPSRPGHRGPSRPGRPATCASSSQRHRRGPPATRTPSRWSSATTRLTPAAAARGEGDRRTAHVERPPLDRRRVDAEVEREVHQDVDAG